MEPDWTPKTHVSVGETGVAVDVELGSVCRDDIELTVEANQLRISGHSNALGSFDKRIEIPSGHNLTSAKASYQTGILRIHVPRQHDPPSAKPFSGTS